MTFAHLHTHSHFSLLDGLGKPEEYVARAAELEQPAVALTDHGSLSGAYRLWKASQATGVKPIVGCEVYFAPKGRTHKEPVRLGTEDQRQLDVGGTGAHTHLTLLARNAAGVRNLYRMQAAAYSEGFYRKPRIDLELLSEHSGGLICLTGCAGSLLCTYVKLRQWENAKQHVSDLKDIFDDRLYIETMFHGINEPDLNELELNQQLISVAYEHKLPLVMTNDLHYCREEDAPVHDALLCVQTHAKVADEKRFRFNGSKPFHLASLAQMEHSAAAAAIPASALHNTLEIANSVDSYDLVFAHTLRMPEFRIPDDWDADAAEYDLVEWENA